MRLHRDTRGNRGQAGQLGVGCLLAGHQHRRHAAGQHRVDAGLPEAIEAGGTPPMPVDPVS